MLRTVFLLTLCLAPACWLHAAEIRVPEDQATIQGAINAANPGDTVSIAANTYNINTPLNFNGKAIELVGRDGASSTILDGGNSNTILIIQDVGSGGLVRGLSFRNGQATETFHGGCLALRNSTATIRDSRFENCRTIDGNASSSGGAIKVTDDPNNAIRSNPLIENSVFLNNRSFSQGGAIHVIGATARIIGNTFIGNVVAGEPESGGGGVKASFSEGQAVQVRENTFEDNTATFAGGAISAFASDMDIVDNIIRNNGNARFGGGIHLESLVGSGGDRQFTVINNLIENNQILDVPISNINPSFDRVSGAGIHVNFGVGSNLTASTVQIRNNVIRNNTATDSRCDEPHGADICAAGGGIIFFNGRMAEQHFTDNVLDDNVSDLFAAGNFDKVRLNFRNNHVEGNRARFAHPGVACVNNDFANPTLCDIQRNRFIDNRYSAGGTGTGANQDAGALFVLENSVNLVNNLFASNFGHFATVFIRSDRSSDNGAFSDIWHNTFADNQLDSTNFAMLMARGESNIRNNVFDGGIRGFRIQDFTSATSIVNNNFTAQSTAVGRFGTSNINTVADLNSESIASGNTALGPGFANPGSGDFSLDENSPLIDLVACISGVNVDLDGNSRPFGSACDPGAFEFFIDDTIFADRFES